LLNLKESVGGTKSKICTRSFCRITNRKTISVFFYSANYFLFCHKIQNGPKVGFLSHTSWKKKARMMIQWSFLKIWYEAIPKSIFKYILTVFPILSMKNNRKRHLQLCYFLFLEEFSWRYGPLQFGDGLVLCFFTLSYYYLSSEISIASDYFTLFLREILNLYNFFLIIP